MNKILPYTIAVWTLSIAVLAILFATDQDEPKTVSAPLPKRPTLVKMEEIYAIHPSQPEQWCCVNDDSPATHFAYESLEALCCECADIIGEFRDSLVGLELFTVAWRNEGE